MSERKPENTGARSRRLQLSRSDFASVIGDQKAQRLTSTHFSILHSSKKPGLAVVVSKKVSKTSVGRHLLKRRIREACHSSTSKILTSSALIVYARAGSTSLSFQDMTSELSTLIRRILP